MFIIMANNHIIWNKIFFVSGLKKFVKEIWFLYIALSQQYCKKWLSMFLLW